MKRATLKKDIRAATRNDNRVFIFAATVAGYGHELHATGSAVYISLPAKNGRPGTGMLRAVSEN